MTSASLIRAFTSLPVSLKSYFFATLSPLCCTSRPLGVTDWRGRSFPTCVFAAEWSKVFHWAALSDTLLRHLRRGKRPIVFQLLLLWEIRVTCGHGNRGTLRDWREGRTDGRRHIYYFRFQEDVRSVELQVFSQGWEGAGLCVWKLGLVMFFLIPAALQVKGANWG